MRRRGRTGIVSHITLPVTPMLDMTFQLLFFLVLTMKPSTALEGKFKLQSVEAGRTGVTVTADDPVEPGEKLTIVLRALPDRSGAIGGLTLQALEGEWTFADAPALQRHLTARRQEGRPAQVLLKPDSGLRYAAVMTVFDLCWQAGFREIGFANH